VGTFPHDHRANRPPGALTRQEVADELGEPYARVYFWTRKRPDGPVVRPSLGEAEGKWKPAWFSREDVEQLREFFDALNTVQRFTGSRTPRGGTSRSRT
jgi:hypothetical protein